MQWRDAGEDPLAAVVALLRPRTVLSKIVSGAGRWCVRYAPHEEPAFCLLLEGTCLLDLEETVLELHAGDFALFPGMPGFTIASDLAAPPTRGVPTDASAVRHGTAAGPPTMRLLGGYFRFDHESARLLVGLLPSMICIRRREPGSARVRRVARLIGDEALARRTGRDLVLARLVEVLLIEALRVRPPPSTREERGLLAALADPALARSLRALHADVTRRWTVASLARAAGMSRAAFAERFTRTVGMPPIEYVVEWRMALAKDLLRRERAPLAEVAERVGYQSVSAFSAAFARRTGVSPSAFARAVG